MRPPLIALAALGALAAPGLARAELHLLDREVIASLADPPEGGDFDFDLLPKPKQPQNTKEDQILRRRHAILQVHQGIGLGLIGLQLGTTVVGQLNYNDKFGVANTGRYKLTHQVFAYSTVGVFALNGALALLAPEPPKKVHHGFDRVTLHKISMATASVAMLAQAGLGIYTASREGFENQQDYGQIHLVLGYVTLAAVATGVSALIF